MDDNKYIFIVSLMYNDTTIYSYVNKININKEFVHRINK
jgi:hypothetical protein